MLYQDLLMSRALPIPCLVAVPDLEASHQCSILLSAASTSCDGKTSLMASTELDIYTTIEDKDHNIMSSLPLSTGKGGTPALLQKAT